MIRYPEIVGRYPRLLSRIVGRYPHSWAAILLSGSYPKTPLSLSPDSHTDGSRAREVQRATEQNAPRGSAGNAILFHPGDTERPERFNNSVNLGRVCVTFPNHHAV